MFPYGDGSHVLLIAGDEGTDEPRCFKLHGGTGVVNEIVTTLPTGAHFFGDLIAPHKILVIALRKEVGGTVTDFWEFDTASGLFTQLGVTGSIPACEIDYSTGCYFDKSQFVLVSFTPGESGSGKTYIFNRETLQWTQLNIAAPYGETSAKQTPLRGFQMANVNGQIKLVGGLLSRETLIDRSRIWELQRRATILTSDRLKWEVSNATFPPLQNSGFCSTLATDSTPSGLAVLFAGHGKFSDAKGDIYTSIQGGLVATTDRGLPAITLSDNCTFAQFVIPDYTADWEVLGYMISPSGKWTVSNLKAEISFDAGETWQIVTPDRSLPIGNSATPGVRMLRVTMYNLKTSKPVLSKIVEVFDEDGNDSTRLEGRVVIRYDAPGTVNCLYIDRDGLLTLSSDILPSTADRCLLHKVTPNGSSAPTIKNYINRRRPHIKYSKTKSGSGSSVQFDNELAVPVRYVNAFASTISTNVLYKIPEPAPDFDGLIAVTGVTTNGDTWYVELEG